MVEESVFDKLWLEIWYLSSSMKDVDTIKNYYLYV